MSEPRSDPCPRCQHPLAMHGRRGGDNLGDSDQPEEAKQIARNAGFVELPSGLWLCETHATAEDRGGRGAP